MFGNRGPKGTKQNPKADGKDGTGQRGPKALLDVRSQKVKRLDREHAKTNRDRPVDVGPKPQPDPRQMDSAGQPQVEMRAHNHDTQRPQQQQADQEREGYRKRTSFPEGVSSTS